MIRRILTTDFDDTPFDRRRRRIVFVALVCAIVLAVLHGWVAARELFANEQGIRAAKVLIAAVIGCTSGVALWAIAALGTVSFAPDEWLRHSRKGRQWMQRSGIRLDNIGALRSIASSLALVALAYTIFNVYTIVVALRA